MSVKVDAQTSGLDDAVKQLQNPQPLLDKIGQYLVSSTQARIRTTKTSPDGAPWQQWSPRTAIARQRTGGSLLFQSGRLFSSIDYNLTQNQVEVGTNVPYARFLQQGTPRMPARPFLGISKGDEDAIAGLIRRHFGA